MILTIWLEQRKLNNQHPIRSHLSNQSEITKISPRGDGYLEEFGKEVEPSSCWCDRFGVWNVVAEACRHALGDSNVVIDHCCVVHLKRFHQRFIHPRYCIDIISRCYNPKQNTILAKTAEILCNTSTNMGKASTSSSSGFQPNQKYRDTLKVCSFFLRYYTHTATNALKVKKAEAAKNCSSGRKKNKQTQTLQ